MSRAIGIAVAIIAVLAIVVFAMSFFQATGVNRENPDAQTVVPGERPVE
jgi:hypothetical protein